MPAIDNTRPEGKKLRNLLPHINLASSPVSDILYSFEPHSYSILSKMSLAVVSYTLELSTRCYYFYFRGERKPDRSRKPTRIWVGNWVWNLSQLDVVPRLRLIWALWWCSGWNGSEIGSDYRTVEDHCRGKWIRWIHCVYRQSSVVRWSLLQKMQCWWK